MPLTEKAKNLIDKNPTLFQLRIQFNMGKLDVNDLEGLLEWNTEHKKFDCATHKTMCDWYTSLKYPCDMGPTGPPPPPNVSNN